MAKNMLLKYIDEMFRDMHPSWRNIINSKDIRGSIADCIDELWYDLNNKGINQSNINELNLDDFIRPGINNIFEPFKHFDANNLKAIIIGQDPYPNKANAMGLSFSVPHNVKIPSSLKMIYKNLLRHKLLSNMPNHGDLTSWAKQGILLLNIYLTRTPLIVISKDRDELLNNKPQETDNRNDNILLDVDSIQKNNQVYVKGNGSSDKNCLHRFWIKFTSKLLRFISTKLLYIIHRRNAEIHVLLWGNEAQKLQKYINEKPINTNRVIIHKWGHPSPLNRNNSSKNPESFIYSDHFTYIDIDYDSILYHTNNNAYEQYMDQFFMSDINENNMWDEKWLYDDGTNTHLNLLIREKNKQKKLFALFTDGGCDNNGSDDATGTFAVYIPEKYHNDNNYAHGIICGNMEPLKLEYDKDIGTISYVEEFHKITNSRTELLALAYALYCININWNDEIFEIHIISDSSYAIDTFDRKMYNDITTDFNVVNGDIIKIIYYIAKKIAKKIMGNKQLSIRDALYKKIKIFHQNSHVNKKDEHKYDPDHLEGNKKADEICNELKKMTKVFNNEVYIYKT